MVWLGSAEAGVRFASPEECKAAAERAAPNFLMCYKKYDHDLNPYCTQGGRSDWQRGYDGDSPRSYETSFDCNIKYQLGAAPRKLIDSQPKD